MKILLADDDSSARELVAKALISDQHEVVSVGDGAAAVEAIEADGASFELLIADVDMPGHNGLEVAQRARAVSADIAVLLISAHVPQLERASELGSKTAALVKPFGLDALRAEIAKLVG